MKISVLTTAYNHQNTLQRAIDSVQMQKGVLIEHIIIDDTERNYGMMRTFEEGFAKCTGDYIAICDGDDYWISKYKLKRQVEYMEEHSDCGLCITKVMTEINIDGKCIRFPVKTDVKHINENMSFDSLLKGNAFIYAQSYLIRKSVFDRYIDFGKFVKLKFITWDLPIVLELIKHTKFYCLDFHSAVYVKNMESVTNTMQRIKRLKYILGQYRIKIYFICKYGCKINTILYLIYRFIRHLYSIIFKRWNKRWI